MDKKKRIIMLAASLTCLLTIPAYANDYMDNVMESFEEIDDIGMSTIPEISFHRGEVISHIEAGLRDMGFGVAHVSGEVACHHSVEGIHIRLMLQKWNEEHQEWATVNSQDFEWNAEDLPEGEELTYAYINYNIPGCESGEVYRTKGIFGAWDEEFDDAWLGYSQGMRF